MIKITDITPLLKSGYVAMDKCGHWYWYASKPFITTGCDYWINQGGIGDVITAVEAFKDFGCLQDIEPAEDWKQSLIKVCAE